MELQVIDSNSDWLFVLFAPAVNGQSNIITLELVFQQSFENCSVVSNLSPSINK